MYFQAARAFFLDTDGFGVGGYFFLLHKVADHKPQESQRYERAFQETPDVASGQVYKTAHPDHRDQIREPGGDPDNSDAKAEGDAPVHSKVC